jgi:hypothetical protein
MEVEGRLLANLSQVATTGATNSLPTLVVDISVQEVIVRCRTPYGRGSLR